MPTKPAPAFNDDVLAWFAYYLSKGMNPHGIREILLKDHGIEITNSAAYAKVVPKIFEKGLLELATVLDSPLTKILKEKGQGFDLEGGVKVTRTSDIGDVALHAAHTIRDIITKIAQEKKEIHIGFSGGNTTRRIFQRLVRLLTSPAYNFPKGKTLVFHALVAGFDDAAPGTDPSSFFIYLDDIQSSFDRTFVLLHAPAFLPSKDLRTICEYPSVRYAKEQASHLDLVVTSAAAFADDHSQLKNYYYKHHAKSTVDRLTGEGCIGDILWLPVTELGPLDLSGYKYRPMTLLELSELPERTDRGTKVLLVIGPCADPRRPCDYRKTEVLNAVLNFQRQKKYFTHLVCDRSTAEEWRSKCTHD